MNVLAVTHIFPFRADPQEGIFNSLQIAELSKQTQITLLTPVRWTLGFRKCSRSAAPGAPPVFDRYSPLFLYPPGMLRGYHGHFYLASIRRAAAQARKKTRFDLVYGMFAFPDGWAAARLAKKWGLPFVLKVHGSDVHQLKSDPAQLGRLAETIRSARKIIAVSDSLCREVKEVVPEASVTVVRNGIDLDTFSPGSMAEARHRLDMDVKKKLALFVGRLERVKGADLLPKIAAGLGTEVSWAVIGRGSLGASLREEMSGYDVRWIPKASHAELVPWYRAADVVVIPSRNEGLPNALLEALACDRPVVAAGVGGIPEVLTDPDAGTLVKAGDCAAFAHGISSRLDHPPRQGAGRALVSGMGWEKSAAELMKALEEALKG